MLLALDVGNTQTVAGLTATDAFLNGSGDVLLTSESSAIDAERKDSSLVHITPPQTLMVDNLVAVVNNGPHVQEATALKDYLYTPEAQRLWARVRQPISGSAEAVDHRRPR